jgi:hypothetical protein
LHVILNKMKVGQLVILVFLIYLICCNVFWVYIYLFLFMKL